MSPDGNEERAASRVKNILMNVYSAVALSMKTSMRDRSRASNGSFYGFCMNIEMVSHE